MSLIKESTVRVITLKIKHTEPTNEMFYYLKPKNLEIVGFIEPFTVPYTLVRNTLLKFISGHGSSLAEFYSNYNPFLFQDIIKVDCEKSYYVPFPSSYLVKCKMLYLYKLLVFCRDYHLKVFHIPTLKFSLGIGPHKKQTSCEIWIRLFRKTPGFGRRTRLP